MMSSGSIEYEAGNKGGKGKCTRAGERREGCYLQGVATAGVEDGPFSAEQWWNAK